MPEPTGNIPARAVAVAVTDMIAELLHLETQTDSLTVSGELLVATTHLRKAVQLCHITRESD